MTTQEHLLTCLIEECSEVIQAITKSLRFGLYDGYPNTDRINIRDLYFELLDLMAVLELLQEADINVRPFDIFTGYSDNDYVKKKKQKVLEYIEYAKNLGTIKDDT